MPFYPPLQIVKPENAFSAYAEGLGVAEQQQARSMQNALMQRKLEQDTALQNALKGYTPGGDVTEIMRANPAIGLKFQDQQMDKEKLGMLKTKQQWDAIKPGMDMLYMMGGVLRAKPELYPQIRAEVTKQSPVLGGMLSPEWSEDAQKQFETNYIKMRKLEDPFGAAKLLLRAEEVGAKKDYYAGKLSQGEQKLDIDRQKAEQEKYPGLVGTSFKLYKKLNGVEPNADELEEFHNRFVQDTAKTKNPGALAIESLNKEDEYKYETDPAKKKAMREQRTREIDELMAPYRRGNKGRTQPAPSNTVTIRNKTTGETKTISRQEAVAKGYITE